MEFYQILYSFAFYAMVGYLAEQILYGIHGIPAKRGLTRGPYGMIYGLGGLLSVLFLHGLELSFPLELLTLLLMAFLLDVGSMMLIHVLSGSALYKLSPWAILLGAGGGLIAIYHGQVLLTAFMEALPNWGIMLLLLLFYVPFTVDMLRSLLLLLGYREAMEDVEFLMRGETLERPIESLLPYRGWLLAYPYFFSRTKSSMDRFIGVDRADRLMDYILK